MPIHSELESGDRGVRRRKAEQNAVCESKEENHNGPDESESRVADRTTCIDAVKALTDAEIRRLKSYADSRACGVRHYADGDDLLHDAIARTLAGVRKWKPERVDLVLHLKGCVRSIANRYDKESRRLSELPDDLAFDDAERLHRTAMLNTARWHLKPDAVAFEVLNLLLEGHTPGAIRDLLNIDPSVYNAARKRITRCLRATLAS